MPRQLILSVGLHKTGTSSIQVTCARNKRALLNAGFLYPEFSFDGQRVANHTGAFRFMFRKEADRIGLSSRKSRTHSHAEAIALGSRFKEVVASRLLGQSADLLMVAEGVSVFSVDELQELKSWFNDRGWGIRVVCFVRWLSSWINSMAAQRVIGDQHRSIIFALGEFLETSGVIRPRIANIKKVFSEAEFYSYEAALRHRRGPVGFFLEAIGVRQLETVIFARANEGRSDCAIRLLSSINEALGPGFADGAANPRYAENNISRLNAIPGVKFSLRLDEAAPLLPLLRAENEWLKETLGEEFYDPRLEFGGGPCVWTKESLARLREILGTATPVVRALVASYMATLASHDRAGRITEGYQP